jgi:uroporphyrinogen-III synthase
VLVAVPPGPLAVLRCLAEAPGRVRSRQELLARLPGGGDEHAVEMAVTRLRTALGDTRIIQTVVKRGYRLAFEPEHGGGACLEASADTEDALAELLP